MKLEQKVGQWDYSFACLRHLIYFSYHPFIHYSHACSLIISLPSLSQAINYHQLFTSAGHVYPMAQRHTYIVSLSSCGCLFRYGSLAAFSSFMLLFCMAPLPPHYRPLFADSTVSFHLPHLSQQNRQPPPPQPVSSKDSFIRRNYHTSPAVNNIISDD